MIWEGQLHAGDIDFNFTGAMMYDFILSALPGPDGIYNTDPGDDDDDIPIWKWSAHMHDQGYNYEGHIETELARYPGATTIEAAPGSAIYGLTRPNVFVPTSWNLFDGETLSFEFPTGNVPFYDPNLTPISGDANDRGRLGEHVVISAPLTVDRRYPVGYGDWDPVLKTWDIVGPTNVGLVGHPDNYPTEAGGAIYFTAVPEPGATMSLAAGSALLALLNRRRARRSGSV
jgi:hypothetical protein